MKTEFQPGALVKLRGREWVVMPSNDKDILLVKPLGGSDEETTGIFLPFSFRDEKPEPAEFPFPSIQDIGNYSTANILYNASRLSFRSAAGPFRCIGKLSFRPRSYQLVPLIMALKQSVSQPVRLFIADDVGVGKTIEALLIIRELLDRGEIKRFAVVCLPHLCEQWQQELKEKFSIDAVIIRSSTAAQLDRKIQGDASIFRQYPYQVISIDFIKSEPKRSIFLNEAPECIIVDEVHTCAKPAGAGEQQQQRYYLLNSLTAQTGKHLILLTATPHSGKQAEFQSLLGLLHKKYEYEDITSASAAMQKEIAGHLIIRRRADVEQWYENTPFPKRESKEIEYSLSNEYKIILNELLVFARKTSTADISTAARRKFRYFAVLSLLRGVMSSPQAGIAMLTRKAVDISEDDSGDIPNPVADGESYSGDSLPVDIMDKSSLNKTEHQFLKSIADRLQKVKDNKADEALKISLKLLGKGFNPVIFCRFIDTAEYLGEYFKGRLPNNTDMLVVTGLMVDEQRREKIEEFENSQNKRVLISTDCLSEGINLQKYFNAVLHYDLPWNPNRLEQREGRVDRFGQTAKEVHTYLLWGKDNPIDSVVLNVLLKKAREIKRQTGISVPFPEDSQSILDSLLNAVILNPNAVVVDQQLSLEFEDDNISNSKLKVTNAYEAASERDKLTRSIFAQHSINAGEIETDLKEVDEAVGSPKAVKQFVVQCVRELKGNIQPYKEGYRLYATNLPPQLKAALGNKDENLICFDAPVPDGYKFIGRNCVFVEQLCRYVLSKSLSSNGDIPAAARASVIPSNSIGEKTAIVQLRVRNIITDKSDGHQIVAEEMILWGYKGSISDKNYLSHDECKTLLGSVFPSSDYSKQRQESVFISELEAVKSNIKILEDIVHGRSLKLIEAHERFRKLAGGNRYKIVEPVLPPDILGIYIIMPQITNNK
jgi:superfamily II DNA or RNA helicase